ncbi:MAG: peptidase M16 domain-containing protein [Gammaproteobacteria bacterium]|nr:MAG: peptidase M16 domain-containing protein [Gammaproteobacteria bacterium]TND02991.1 MAG: peptidase M16 domain-containing protein [Gammaproteobacteria bacterium]
MMNRHRLTQWTAQGVVAAALLFGLATAQAAADIQTWQTGNGARVYFYAAPELPMVDIQIVFDAGSGRDGDKPGIAHLTNGLLAEGAGDLDADTIAERFDSVGARFGNDSLRDMAVVTLRTLTDPPLLRQAADTLATILTAPTFPADALERERGRTLIALRSQQESPDEIASKAFYKALYGSHPYASPVLGVEDTVSAFTREHLQDYYRRYYVARNAVVAIVGALDRAAAEKLAEQVIGKLPAGQVTPALAQVSAPTEARTVRIDHPSTQSHVLIGQPGITRNDSRYFPLYVGNHALGGNGLVSLISDEVREKRGLSYSSYSYFLPMQAPGPFIMGLQTRNDQTDEAIKVIDNVLNDFMTRGIDAKTLEAAKKNLTGGFALRLASNSKIVGQLASIGFYRLPLDYFTTYIANVDNVTAADVNDAFRSLIQTDKLVTVMVGGGGGDKAP